MASRNWKRSFSQIALRKQAKEKSIHSNTSTSETVLLEFQRFQSISVLRRYVRHFFVHSTECTVSVKYRLVSCLFHVSTSLPNLLTARSATQRNTQKQITKLFERLVYDYYFMSRYYHLSPSSTVVDAPHTICEKYLKQKFRIATKNPLRVAECFDDRHRVYVLCA